MFIFWQFLVGLWTIQHFNCFPTSMIRCVFLCPLVVTPWTFSWSPQVWQLASWVTSSRDHLDVFRLGPGLEITPRGCHCCHLPPALLWATWATANQCSWLLPPRHAGHSLVICLRPCPLSSARSRFFPQENLHQTRNWKKQRDQGLFIVYKMLSHECIYLHPIGSLGCGCDYNHLHL